MNSSNSLQSLYSVIDRSSLCHFFFFILRFYVVWIFVLPFYHVSQMNIRHLSQELHSSKWKKLMWRSLSASENRDCIFHWFQAWLQKPNLEELQKIFFVVTIDKAASNFAFIFKEYYISKLLAENGFSTSKSKSYLKVHIYIQIPNSYL